MIRKIITKEINNRVEVEGSTYPIGYYRTDKFLADYTCKDIRETLRELGYGVSISFDTLYTCPCCGTESLDIRYLNHCCNKYPDHCDECDKRFKCYTEGE